MRARTLLAAVSWLTLAAPAQALVPHAEAVAVTGNAYVLTEITIVQGDSLTLTNLDPQQPHDLASADFVGGNRLFASAAIDFGQSAPVVGVESLTAGPGGTAGRYPFVCRLHAEMAGNITVLPPVA